MKPGSPVTAAALVRLLNDPGRGALLDALLEIRARLADPATAAGWEHETLAVLVDGLLERLERAGIRPLHRPGERLSLTRSEIAGRYHYLGAPFARGERRKSVVVVAPGWRVGGRTLLRPLVRDAEPPP